MDVLRTSEQSLLFSLTEAYIDTFLGQRLLRRRQRQLQQGYRLASDFPVWKFGDLGIMDVIPVRLCTMKTLSSYKIVFLPIATGTAAYSQVGGMVHHMEGSSASALVGLPKLFVAAAPSIETVHRSARIENIASQEEVFGGP